MDRSFACFLPAAKSQAHCCPVNQPQTHLVEETSEDEPSADPSRHIRSTRNHLEALTTLRKYCTAHTAENKNKPQQHSITARKATFGTAQSRANASTLHTRPERTDDVEPFPIFGDCRRRWWTRKSDARCAAAQAGAGEEGRGGQEVRLMRRTTKRARKIYTAPIDGESMRDSFTGCR